MSHHLVTPSWSKLQQLTHRSHTSPALQNPALTEESLREHVRKLEQAKSRVTHTQQHLEDTTAANQPSEQDPWQTQVSEYMLSRPVSFRSKYGSDSVASKISTGKSHWTLGTCEECYYHEYFDPREGNQEISRKDHKKAKMDRDPGSVMRGQHRQKRKRAQ